MTGRYLRGKTSRAAEEETNQQRSHDKEQEGAAMLTNRVSTVNAATGLRAARTAAREKRGDRQGEGREEDDIEATRGARSELQASIKTNRSREEDDQ